MITIASTATVDQIENFPIVVAIGTPRGWESANVEPAGQRPLEARCQDASVSSRQTTDSRAHRKRGIGHFRTAPHPRGMAREIRFAFATCQDWPSGYYTAYRDMLKNDPDLVLHLGDYTYRVRDRIDDGTGNPAAGRIRSRDRAARAAPRIRGSWRTGRPARVG